MRLARLLPGLVDTSRRHARLVLLLALVLVMLSGFAAWLRLGVSTDTDKLFAESLPWRQRAIAFSRDFPQFHDLIVAVIDANAPEEANATAAALAKVLSSDTTHFATVRRPDASPYLQQEGLLFLDRKPLETLLNSTIDAQPFLGQLAADPSARGLFSALSLLGMGASAGQADLTPYLPALRAFHTSLAAAVAGHPRPLSWQRLIGGSLAELGGRYRFVLVQPHLDYGALQPGGAATAALRAAAAQLPFVKDGTAHVRLTGSVPLADEEFATVAQGAVTGLIGSFILITLWLFLALRSWRLIVPALGTLVLGLMLTLMFASLAVGTLNLVSVGFGILFVGIAVDFALQFSVRFREALRDASGDLVVALSLTAGRSGGQILVAATATAAGFLAFVPTDFTGVAELGLIAGIGMLIAFICTLGFLPAFVALCRPRSSAVEVGLPGGHRADVWVARARLPLLAVFAAIAISAVALAPRIMFDADPLHTKNEHTEAMRTLMDLMDDPITNPFTIDVMTPNADAADALARRVSAVPTVAQTVTLDSFVPTNQKEKLALIEDASSILGPSIAVREAPAPVTASQIRLAAQTALSAIQPAIKSLPPDHPLRDIAADLGALVATSDATLMAANSALTQFLPMELDALRTALSAKLVTRADIPPNIARDWVLPDGRTRVQVVPTSAARDSAGLVRFVKTVQEVAPEAQGSAVTIVATSATIVSAFRSAAILALIAIAVILVVALRRLRDAALVLAPLLLSAAMTVLVVVLAPLPINYANIIALPLLLGVGVSFNIYFVMNWRRGLVGPLGSATARAVLFSALTTGTAFGSLALSAHPGTASMGALLLSSLGGTLVASLIFEPALLAALGPPRAPRS